MRMTFALPGGARVVGQAGPFTIETDQPPDATAPSPFTLFLASIGSCAAFYAGSFCRQRGIPTDAVRIVQETESGPTGLVNRVRLTAELPPEFPERYRAAILRAMDQCTVKKHLEHPPAIEVGVQVEDAEPAVTPP